MSRLDAASALAHQAGLSPRRFPAGDFILAGWMRPGKSDYLIVFIEGDGHAWESLTRPSGDPTPWHPIGLALAAAHAEGPVLALARPCQYTMPQEQPECRATVWTDGRFSPAVLAALDQAITVAATESSSSRLILVGYSGGGAAAALIAARRHDVDGLVTVAAPLDLTAWTSLHKISSLTASIDPAGAIDTLRGLRQLHVAGAEDATVPPALVIDFAQRAGAPALVLKGMGHNGPWPRRWPEIWQAFLDAVHRPNG